MLNTKNKIHKHVLVLIIGALGSTGCVTQEAAKIVVMPASPASSGASPYEPYVPPSAAPGAPAESTPAATPPATAIAATPITATPAAAGTAAPDQTSSAGTVIPVPGKTVYQLPAAPGEPTQYIVVDAVRPPVASE